MRQKGEEFFSLLVVITCILGSALLLRMLLSGSLETYSNQLQTDVQTERIRTPLQESDESESQVYPSENASPDPAFPEMNAAESWADGFADSPMKDETYLAGYHFSQQADMMATEACYSRYGGYPLAVTKVYMESSFSKTGYAWYGVVQMDGDIPVIFYYDGIMDIWTLKTDEMEVYYFFDEQTDGNKAELQRLITNYLGKREQTGFEDWVTYG